MKFTFVKDELEKKVKLKKKKKKSSDIGKANKELAESFFAFEKRYTELYYLKIKGINDYEFFKEIINVMDQFSQFGLSYDDFESTLKNQVTRSGWMIDRVRKCTMLQHQGSILKLEIEKRGYGKILKNLESCNSEDIINQINRAHLFIKSLNETIMKIPMHGIAACKECEESKLALKAKLNTLDIFISLILREMK